MSGLKKASRTKSLSLSQDEFIFPRAPRSKKSLIQRSEDTQKIIKYIDDNVIGKGVLFLSPFGRRKGSFLRNKLRRFLLSLKFFFSVFCQSRTAKNYSFSPFLFTKLIIKLLN